MLMMLACLREIGEARDDHNARCLMRDLGLFITPWVLFLSKISPVCHSSNLPCAQVESGQQSGLKHLRTQIKETDA